MNKLINYVKWHWKNEMMFFLFIQGLYAVMLTTILLGAGGVI